MPTEQEIFDAAHAFVAKWEGGFFDHPADPGGVTNCGVSIMFLKALGLMEGDIDGDGDIDREDVLAVTKKTAKELFKRHFWDAPKAGLLPPLVAVAFYDLAVNAGTSRSARILQEVLGVAQDGVIGPKTRAAAAARDQKELVEAMLDCREAWYRRLAESKPSSRAFLEGWLNRTQDCRKLTRSLAEAWSTGGEA